MRGFRGDWVVDVGQTLLGVISYSFSGLRVQGASVGIDAEMLDDGGAAVVFSLEPRVSAISVGNGFDVPEPGVLLLLLTGAGVYRLRRCRAGR